MVGPAPCALSTVAPVSLVEADFSHRRKGPDPTRRYIETPPEGLGSLASWCFPEQWPSDGVSSRGNMLSSAFRLWIGRQGWGRACHDERSLRQLEQAAPIVRKSHRSQINASVCLYGLGQALI